MKTILKFRNNGVMLTKEINTDYDFKINDIVNVTEKDLQYVINREIESMKEKDAPIPIYMKFEDGSMIPTNECSLEVITEYAERYADRLCSCRHVRSVEYDYETDSRIIEISVSKRDEQIESDRYAKQMMR